MSIRQTENAKMRKRNVKYFSKVKTTLAITSTHVNMETIRNHAGFEINSEFFLNSSDDR